MSASKNSRLRSINDAMGVLGQADPLEITSANTLGQVTTIYVPLRCNALEKEEALDLSDEEADEVLSTRPWHVVSWLEEVKGPHHQEYSFPKPVTGADLDCTAEEDTTVNTSVGADVGTPDAEPDFRPSILGVPAIGCDESDGSGFDTDDEEFDMETSAFAGAEKNIPDDRELDELVRDAINSITRKMDDELDRLDGLSTDFQWVDSFDSFRSVPEQFSGPTPGPVKDYDSPYDAFIDIWDRSIIERIAQETNRYAKQTIDSLRDKGQLKHSSRLHTWRDTTADEIMVLLGVFMYMAIDTRISTYEYWRSDNVLEMHKFKSLMAYNRYILLNKFLHFVNNEEISSTSEMSGKLAKLSPIIEHLGGKFNSLYNLDRNIALDESLTSFKGRMSWVQLIRTKAARFGIKSYELCESRTGYMARFEIYTGKSNSSNEDQPLSVDLGDKITTVILDLLKGLQRRGHCVTMDNFYNCPSLARYLKSQGFDCLGTLRTNRRYVPDDISKVPANVPKGTIIARQCGDVSIITWKDTKLASIISTYHDARTFRTSSSGKSIVKPVCINEYNRTMGGIDLKDQYLSMYSLERKRGLKWYIKMFKRLLNISINNAYIMYVESWKRCNKLPMKHREFRYELAKSLIDRHRPRQLEISEPVEQLMRLRRDVVHVPKYENGLHKRKRCLICYRLEKTKMVRSSCTSCGVYLCFGECWEHWHSAKILKGQEKLTRKRKRDE